ncbi:BREX-2 system adenine-specific DNA-methyltransferase PglX [Micromonospora sp. 4G57]|uniref:BREX-2 system adenine-specific DNA-methyltransferase PglX n=1 Tax=Micromonospora sicca TaxID=2202420 RepID=A0ABU5JI02_9ACTN|nr:MULTISPECIES: BREX-2 system adenine-specific DNA-methyltransferase PglX [unclassified Micromonospora]MDZ5442190.1 BREX-2 system adenine-specific DNA-methyltransferase PglX [Micromonospora sp. 4G57]MDZ5492137.1 BREX-2 system adenine-specific DNA-methyltransferase PglX [Micromonospora sp. 4G53]
MHEWTICSAFVATHNHFVLERGGKVFKHSALIIKLPKDASEEQHVRLLGLLNSSTACFWLKQQSYGGGGDPLGDDGARVSAEPWSERYQFNGTNLARFPLPSAYPLQLSREIDGLAQRLATVTPMAVAASGVPSRERLAAARDEWHSTRARMIALQEELDWQVYSLYGLLDEELTAPAGSVPELKLGERAFEIVLARKVKAAEAETQWFARHGSTPITELPAHWSDEYRAVVERRIAVIEGNRNIGLIERPECKRRWASEGWDVMQAKALRDWLLDRCEAPELWYQHVDGLEQPRPLTTAQLADELRRDADVLTVANLYAPGQDLGKVIADLVADEHVPHLAALRYKDSGLAKRADWEQVWDLQRQEDALPDEAAKREFRKGIPVPPKYASADFLKTSYWRHRGKLDVPKERFVSYPGASRDGDPSLLVGWAGWDHGEQAQALATLIVAREQEDGWAADRLLPLVAGLREILPWVRQWHGEFDPEWGASPADIYAGFLAETTNRLHLTDEALTSWRPPKATRGRRAKQ